MIVAMDFIFSILALLQVCSLMFMVFILGRLYHYIRKYSFPESQYTLLFGFVHLRWLAGLYVLMTVTWGLLAFFVLYVF